MINLLPQEQRQEIMYARRNTKLLRWVVGLMVVIALLTALWGVGYLFISSSITSYSSQVEDKRTELQTQKINDTKGRIETFSNNMKLILQVLNQQVIFSQLFRQIGAVMPPGTVLATIEINEVEGGIDLAVQASDYDAATQTQVNLEDPANKLFEKVDIISVNCGGGSEYPCTVNLRALFADKNPFLFLNQSQETEASNE